jgi:uncharacterized membrane protein YraQ (UPF0718 family)
MRKILKDALIYIIVTLVIWGVMAIISPGKGLLAGETAFKTFVNSVEIVVGVLLIVGWIQVWVGPQTMSKFIGEKAGWKGLALASTVPMFMGGSLFIIFPLLKTLRDKGASMACTMAFISAWGGKAPLLPLEIEFLGWKFAVLRILFIIPFAIIMGISSQFILDKLQKRRQSTKSPGLDVSKE